ncbi:hypothetical protein [Streptomyces sp. NPDC047014]|uniref:hypothetical protein n=1 Tax=Streptomyces sp. NPDC047014 TaxID=3155736 RepID=UPI0033C69D30
MTGLPQPAIFDGYDAGAYTLPDELVHARDTHRKVHAQPYPEPPERPGVVIERLMQEVVAALHDGTDLPDLKQIEAARVVEQTHQDAVDIMAGCEVLAAQRVRAQLQECGMAIITDHLKPAHEETWTGFKAAWRILQEYGKTEPRHLLAAPPKVRKASDTCDQLAERYTHITAARTALTILGLGCSDDPRGKYSAIRNYHELSPSRLAMGRPPWQGLSIRHFLGWHTENGGQLWMPTPAEQKDQVWAEAEANPIKRAAGF